MNDTLIRTNVCLSAESKDLLRNRAGDLRIKPAELLRQIIDEYFSNSKNQPQFIAKAAR